MQHYCKNKCNIIAKMVEDLLKNKSLRLTNFRKQVLQLFIDKAKSLTISEIEEALTEYDRITLYRTIKSFIKKGLIHEILMPGELKKLALCDVDCLQTNGQHDHKHVHFQCKTCNEVYCVDIPNAPQIVLAGYQIEQLEIQAYGVCIDCLNR